MTYEGYRCDGCGKEVVINPTLPVLPGWVAVVRRGELLSISTTLFTCSSYKHYCPACAEKGIEP